jgi:hypothetical protein
MFAGLIRVEGCEGFQLERLPLRAADTSREDGTVVVEMAAELQTSYRQLTVTNMSSLGWRK